MQVKVLDFNKLNSLMVLNGYSRASFAHYIGHSPALIHQIVHGQMNPSPRTALKIANALKVDWNELFYTVSREKKAIPDLKGGDCDDNSRNA